MKPIAYFRSPFPSKFGIPRQSGIVPELDGYIEFVPEWRNPDTIRGLEDFDYIWLVWDFSANKSRKETSLVRPPLLGGNTKMGVFATRSPFRHNPIGLSSVRITSIDTSSPASPVIHVSGGDLMDATPIWDIKPYLAYTDSHPDARGGFTEQNKWKTLQVVVPPHIRKNLPSAELSTLIHILELDPRPHYQHDENRIYGMPFLDYDVRFKVTDGVLLVEDLVPLHPIRE